MRHLVLLTLVAGCATGPASLEITPATQTVHTTESVPLPAVAGLDAAGKPVELTTAPTWTVTPESVAKLSADGKSLELLADGTATATATLGTVTATYILEVSLPDTLTLAPLGEATVGTSMPLAATVTADGTAITQHDPIVFAVNDPALASIYESMLIPTAPGVVTVTATSGALTASAEVTILAPAEAPVAEIE